MTTFRIFTRRVWSKDPRTGKYVPDGRTRKKTVCYVDTEQEARDRCKQANANRPTEFGTTAYHNYRWTEYERV